MSHVAWSVHVFVLVTRIFSAKTAEPIEMPFRWLTLVGPRNCVLRVVRDPLWEMGNGNGQLLGVVLFIEKHWESLLQSMQQKGSFNHQ